MDDSAELDKVARRVRGAPKGNTNGQRQRVVEPGLRRTLIRDRMALQRMCDAMVAKACDGDTRAFELIRDALDGKPTQRQELTGAEGKDLFQPELKQAEQLEQNLATKLRLVKG